jgi:hypothetical protein
MLLFEDNDNGFFVFTADSRHWKLKELMWVIHDTRPKYAAIKARKNSAENTILALPAVLLRKNGAFSFHKACFMAKPTRCRAILTVLQDCFFPHCNCAWVWEALRWLLSEQTLSELCLCPHFQFFF